MSNDRSVVAGGGSAAELADGETNGDKSAEQGGQAEDRAWVHRGVSSKPSAGRREYAGDVTL